MVKHYKTIGFFILILLVSIVNNRLKAGHILGTELTYQFVTNQSVELTLKVYRDCQECKFNGVGGGTSTENCSDIPPILVYGVSNGQRNLLQQSNLSLQSIENISTTCAGITNACGTSSSPDYLGGIEVHILKATINLQTYEQQGYCHFYFATSIFSRSNAIVIPGNPIPKFFNYSELDFCGGIKSNSPQLSIQPNFHIVANNSIHHSLGIQKGDADSISVALVEALSDFETAIPYPNGRNYKSPLTVNCIGASCLSEPTATPPVGFYVEPTTSNTVFFPTVTGQVGTIVYEITKWKKNQFNQFVQVGKIRRDYQIQTIFSSNKEPFFERFQSEYAVCSGVPFQLNIPIIDNQEINYQLFTLPSGMTSSISTLNQAPFKSLSLSWTPQNNQVGQTYYATIRVNDINCPLQGLSSKTFKFNVVSNPTLAIQKIVGDCGSINLNAQTNQTNNTQFQWTIRYPNGSSRELFGKQHSFYYLDGGKLNIELRLPNSCALPVIDSLQLPKFTNPDFQLQSIYEGCLGNIITISPTGLVGNSPFTYIWNDINGGSIYTQQVPAQPTELTLKIKDRFGCEQQKQTFLQSYKTFKPIVIDSHFCTQSSGNFYLNPLVKSTNTFLNYGFEQISSGTQLIDSNSLWYFDKNQFSVPFVRFRYFEQDENNCKYFDTFDVYKRNIPNISSKSIGPYCATSEEKVNLYTYFNLSPTVGDFYIEDNIKLEGGIFEPSKYALLSNINLGFKSNTQYCFHEFNWQIEIIEMPDMNWLSNRLIHTCQNNSPIELGGSFTGGSWLGNGVSGFKFYPQLDNFESGKTNRLYFNYTEINSGCTILDSLHVVVWNEPSATLNLYNKSNELILGGEICISQAPVRIEIVKEDTLFPYLYSFSEIDYTKGMFVNGLYELSEEGGVHIYKTEINSSLCEQNTIIEKPLMVSLTPKIYTSYLTDYCEGEALINIDYDCENTSKVIWYINGIESGIQTNFPSKFTTNLVGSGMFDISTKMQNGSCEENASLPYPIKVNANPQPKIFSTPERHIPIDLKYLFLEDKGKYELAITNRQWKIEGNEYTDTNKLVYRVLSTNGLFEAAVTVVDSNGCMGTDVKEFEISGPLDLYIPTAFSPNEKGPESNNVFKVNPVITNSFQLQIISRWGEVIFYTTDPSDGWNGTFMNEPCPSGVYGYYIRYEHQFGGFREFKGTVTLIR